MDNGQDHACTILVVDREPRIRELVGTILTVAGHRVLQATGGAQALRIVNGAKIDLVITDMNMPDVGGVELAKRLRAAAPELPILLMSAYIDYQSFPPKVLEKPFHMAELNRRVAQALRGQEDKHLLCE
jgi:DNA-binding response OmpR family regulator